jgi:predicted dinucleotide-binding enzyme
MTIAVIGNGNIGSTLGRRWTESGLDVVYGSRTEGSPGPDGAPMAGIDRAIAGADTVVLAIPGNAVAGLVEQRGPALAGKVVIDATNQLAAAEFSGRAAIRAAAPGAHYARAFNTLGWENFANPPEDADLFFAADEPARQRTAELIAAVGLRPAYVGDGDAAATVDALLPLWFALVKQHGTRLLALRIVD